MNQFQPTDPENLPLHPEPNLQQYVENSTLGGGMQAVVGDKNNQNQANSSSTGNVVNVNVSVDSQASTPSSSVSSETRNYEQSSAKLHRPTSGCLLKLVLGGFVVSIAIGNYIFVETVGPPLSTGMPSPTTGTSSPGIPEPSININGTWYDAYGTKYQFTQGRNFLTFISTNPKKRVFSEGRGTIEDQKFELVFVTNLPSSGKGMGKISNDGKSLTVDFYDSEIGQYTRILRR